MIEFVVDEVDEVVLITLLFVWCGFTGCHQDGYGKTKKKHTLTEWGGGVYNLCFITLFDPPPSVVVV